MMKEILLERLRKEADSINMGKAGIDLVKENLKKYSEIENDELMLRFAREYNMIHFSRTEKNSKDKLYIQIYPFTHPKTIAEWQGDVKNVMGVAWIHNASGSIEMFFMNDKGIFFNHKAEYIADNEDDFFDHLMNVEYDYHAPIQPETLELLKKAGWYEGRKTDISPLIIRYRKEGIVLTEAQIEFMQEFGGIKGLDEQGDSFEVCVDPKYSMYKKSKPPTKDDLRTYGPLNIVGYNENIDFLLAGAMGDLMTRFWISTDGRLFADMGAQMGRTIMEGFQYFLLDRRGYL